jgi:hypothetical protein
LITSLLLLLPLPFATEVVPEGRTKRKHDK